MTASGPSTNPTGDLQGAVAHLLVPLFADGGNDDATAFKIARTTLETYQPESGADYVNVARTLAFSMTALTLLRDIAKTDMPMKEKLRLFGRANALNRSADQSERTMMQRRRFQQANKEAAWRPQPIPELADPLEEAEIEASVAEAMAIYVAECAQRKADAAASAQPQPEPAQPPPAASSPAAPPAPPAIRHQGLAHLPPNPAHRRNAEDRITEILNQAAAAFPAMTYPAPATRHPT